MPTWKTQKLLILATLLIGLCSTGRADDWPQWLGPQRDGVWRENGIVERFPSGGPRFRWRTSIGAGYAGPAVADGRVFVTDRMLPKDVSNPLNPFAKTAVPGKERVLCLEETTGNVLWKHEYDCTYEVSYASGPRTTPLFRDGKVYTLGTMGHLICLDAASGKPVWSKNLPEEYQAKVPLWGFAAHPLLDGKKLICLVGGKAGLVVAFDKDTGNPIWQALSAKEIGYCPPMIFDVGGVRQLIIWEPEGVHGLDPDTGKVHWSERWVISRPSCMTISTPRHVDGLLFLTSFYNGSMMLRLDADHQTPNVVWKSKTWKGGSGTERSDRTDTLHSIISTPFLKDGYIYGVCSYGQLRCLKAATGDRLWETFQATSGKEERWGNAFIVAQGDRYFLFSEKGDLIIARLTPEGYTELSRAHILQPTNLMAGRPVVWSHPAFANRNMYARNDAEIVCVSLAAAEQQGSANVPSRP
jgi:outer membrane protein assembly factor BamB